MAYVTITFFVLLSLWSVYGEKPLGGNVRPNSPPAPTTKATTNGQKSAPDQKPKCQPSGTAGSRHRRDGTAPPKRSGTSKKNNQKKTCKPGQAMSRISITVDDDGYQTFEIECANTTAQDVVSVFAKIFSRRFAGGHDWSWLDDIEQESCLVAWVGFGRFRNISNFPISQLRRP